VCVILDARFTPLNKISFDCATFGTRFNIPVFPVFFGFVVLVLVFSPFSSSSSDIRILAAVA
jgi:hypothetical protein